MATIYTKTGDDGTTGRLFGGRVPKHDPLIDACGDIDEAVAALGVARAALAQPPPADAAPADSSMAEALADVVLALQRDLFVAAAHLSANPHARDRLEPGVSQVTADMVDRIERDIDRLVDQRPLRPVFVVPGTTAASAALDLARAVLRRAERSVVVLVADDHDVPSAVVAHLNRAGDLVYVLARQAVGDREELPSHD